MKTIVIMIMGVLAISFYSCKDEDVDRIDDPIGDETVELNYNFDSGDEGWDAGIAGFLIDEEDLYGFNVEQTTAPFDEDEGVLKLSASNPNDHLFMYASKQITGLEPNTQYNINFTVELASLVVVDTTGFVTDTIGLGTDTTGVDTTGIYTSINDTVFIKAGVANEELVTEADDFDFLQLVGIDIGEPGADGNDLVVIGSFPGDTTDINVTLHTASTETPITAITNDDGDLWLLVGAESFGTNTEIYIGSISVEIEK